MDSAASMFVAAPFRVLVTNEGAHPARKWAQLTAELIVTPNVYASVGSREQIAQLQFRISDVLLDTFEQVSPATPILGITMMSKQAAARICDLADETKWADVFRAPPIEAAIQEIVHRNLMSSLGISLRME